MITKKEKESKINRYKQEIASTIPSFIMHHAKNVAVRGLDGRAVSLKSREGARVFVNDISIASEFLLKDITKSEVENRNIVIQHSVLNTYAKFKLKQLLDTYDLEEIDVEEISKDILKQVKQLEDSFNKLSVDEDSKEDMEIALTDVKRILSALIVKETNPELFGGN